ncbi:MAG: nitroreductase family protein, partial [Candidatus Heimdallarchaeaceae archaeon]
IYQRRALRAFEHVEISDEFIKEVATLAARAASCANKQPWRFIFVRDKEILSKLHESLISGNYWAKDASMMVAVFSQSELDCVVGQREYFLFDTGMATAQLMLAIVNKGLVAHAMAGFNEKVAKEALGIPEEMRLITLIAVGKQSDKIEKLSEKHASLENQISKRKDFDEFTYFNLYKKT